MSGLALRLQLFCEDLFGPHARSARKTADKDWKLKGVKYLGDMAGRRVVPTEAGDQTKERILSAAEQLFAKSGFDGVSMRDIGRAAEVPFALITYHFQSKLGLYQALFRRHQACSPLSDSSASTRFRSQGTARPISVRSPRQSSTP